MISRALRPGLWLAALLVTAILFALSSRQYLQTHHRLRLRSPAVPALAEGPISSQVEDPPFPACLALADLSEQAAALTGSLALAGSEERPTLARTVAVQVDSLVMRATLLEGGPGLADTLANLADALEAYAGGDSSAPARVEEASARNAALRAQYRLCRGGQQ